MVKHVCYKEDKFTDLEKRTDKLDDVINGNGQEGLVKSTTKLEVAVNNLVINVNELTESTKAFRTAASAFEKFQAVVEKEKEDNEKLKIEKEKQYTAHNINRRWTITTFVSVIVLLLGIIGTLLMKG